MQKKKNSLVDLFICLSVYIEKGVESLRAGINHHFQDSQLVGC